MISALSTIARAANPSRPIHERLVYAPLYVPRLRPSGFRGVLREVCEEEAPHHCATMKNPGGEHNQDATWKGVFVRDLREFYDLDRTLGETPLVREMRAVLAKQRSTLLAVQPPTAEFGFYWIKPVPNVSNKMSFGTQASAIDALNAGLGL